MGISEVERVGTLLMVMVVVECTANEVVSVGAEVCNGITRG